MTTTPKVSKKVDLSKVFKMPKESNYSFEAPETDAERAVQAFLKGDPKGRFGNYFIEGSELVFKTTERGTDEPGAVGYKDSNGNTQYRVLKREVLALRLIDGTPIGNSSQLEFTESRMAFGRRARRWGRETQVQAYLSRFVSMVPFNVFTQENLDPRSIQVLDKQEGYQIIRKRNKIVRGVSKEVDSTEHFTGAALFKLKNKYFLFDIDRQEIKQKIFNAFMVELPRECMSIKEAYDALMPEAVKDALANGVKVKRQGEFFYIPIKIDPKKLGAKVFTSKNKKNFERFRIQAGNNRPNYATTGFEHRGVAYVSGRVEHSGREHAPMHLKGWYRVMPNTATRSLTIRGEID